MQLQHPMRVLTRVRVLLRVRVRALLRARVRVPVRTRAPSLAVTVSKVILLARTLAFIPAMALAVPPAWAAPPAVSGPPGHQASRPITAPRTTDTARAADVANASRTVGTPVLTGPGPGPGRGTAPRRKTSTAAPVPALTPAMAQCFDWASRRFGMSSHLLYAIALQESGLNPRAVNRNTNGSQDIGLMQINSSWGPMLARYGIRPSDLWDPCTNIFVGAWILGDNLARMGPTVAALGAYNARDPVKREAYARRVLERLHRLTAPSPDARLWQQAPLPSPVSASRQSGESRTSSAAGAFPATGPHLASP